MHIFEAILWGKSYCYCHYHHHPWLIYWEIKLKHRELAGRCQGRMLYHHLVFSLGCVPPEPEYFISTIWQLFNMSMLKKKVCPHKSPVTPEKRLSAPSVQVIIPSVTGPARGMDESWHRITRHGSFRRASRPGRDGAFPPVRDVGDWRQIILLCILLFSFSRNPDSRCMVLEGHLEASERCGLALGDNAPEPQKCEDFPGGHGGYRLPQTLAPEPRCPDLSCWERRLRGGLADMLPWRWSRQASTQIPFYSLVDLLN